MIDAMMINIESDVVWEITITCIPLSIDMPRMVITCWVVLHINFDFTAQCARCYAQLHEIFPNAPPPCVLPLVVLCGATVVAAATGCTAGAFASNSPISIGT